MYFDSIHRKVSTDDKETCARHMWYWCTAPGAGVLQNSAVALNTPSVPTHHHFVLKVHH